MEKRKIILFTGDSITDGNRYKDPGMEWDLYAINPDVLSILVGVNNGPLAQNNNIAISLEEYEMIYRLLLEDVKKRLLKCHIVLMELFVCRAGWVNDSYDEWRAAVMGYGEVYACVLDTSVLHYVSYKM